MLKQTILATALTLTLSMGVSPNVMAKEAPTHQAAMEMMKAEDYKGAAKAFSSMTKKNPEETSAYMGLGYAYIMLGKYGKAISAYESAEALGAGKVMTQYNIACARSLDGDIEGAFMALNLSVDAGWGDVEHLDKDSDLDNLRSDARYGELKDKAQRMSTPCRFDETYQAMEGFVGEWAVVNSEGHKIALHTIVSIEEGCAFQETWKSKNSGMGQALTWYNPAEETWNKQWVGARGWTVALEGTLNEGVLQLNGESQSLIKPTMDRKITFEFQEDGSIRNVSSVSKDSGKTWYTDFDGSYVPLDIFKAAHPKKYE